MARHGGFSTCEMGIAIVVVAGSGPSMTTQRLVSVIIPFANAGRFFEEAIQSVVAQTYECWELILVDDGASDGSTDVARRYAAQCPGKVRYLEHDGHANHGVCVSRNVGIRHARGEYIAFLDADDVWLPEKLARQTAILDAEADAAMVYGPSKYWYSWTGRPEDVARDRVNGLRTPSRGLVKPPALLISSLQGTSYTPNPSNLLVRRDAVKRVGGFEESFVGAVQPYEDQAFVAKLHLNEVVFVSDACWDKYRKHADSSVSVMKQTGSARVARLFYLRWLEKYLAQQQVESRAVWKALRATLWRHRHPIVAAAVEASGHPRKYLKAAAVSSARHIVPRGTRVWLKARWNQQPYCPPPGSIRFGSLRRLTPIGGSFGKNRGLPVDRFYIERFLADNAASIRGHVLEIGGAEYTARFGGDRVTKTDVLHVESGNPQATIVADLSARDAHIPSDTFDCVILTQTLPVIYDVKAAVRTVHRILRSGGVVLATSGGISQISRWDMDRWGHYWSFTTLSARRLFEELFSPGQVTVRAYGNVLAATAFLQGLAAHELRDEELTYCDPDYEVLIGIKATKAA